MFDYCVVCISVGSNLSGLGKQFVTDYSGVL